MSWHLPSVGSSSDVQPQASRGSDRLERGVALCTNRTCGATGHAAIACVYSNPSSCGLPRASGIKPGPIGGSPGASVEPCNCS